MRSSHFVLAFVVTISASALLAGCRSVDERQQAVLNLIDSASGTVQGVVDQANNAAELGGSVIDGVGETIDNVGNRIDNIVEGVEKIKEGKDLIEEGIEG